MKKSICLLLCLLVLGYALTDTNQTTSSSNSTYKKVDVTKSGHIPLYKNSRGFYAGVDLTRDNSSWPYFGPNTVSMELAFYSNQTLLITDCLSFTKYDCNKYQCNQFNWSYVETNYPYFTADGMSAEAQVYLDYGHWNLNDYALIATKCYSSTLNNYGSGLSGILGMGLIPENGVRNYNVSNPIFSLHLKPVSGMDAILMFQKDLRYASSFSPAFTLQADQNWITNFSGYIQMEQEFITLNPMSIILDLYADTIGFPVDIFSSILQKFAAYGVNCYGSMSRPNCTRQSTSSLSTLPRLKIFLHLPHTGIIDLKPDVYVLNYSSYSPSSQVPSFTLNMKALSSKITQENYVTPAFDNCIILNAEVASQYYIVFEATSLKFPIISFYSATNNPPVPGSIPWWGFGIGGVILAGIICACCRCCYRPKIINVQRPLILNDQYAQPGMPVVINSDYQQPQMIIQQPQPQVYYNPPTYN